MINHFKLLRCSMALGVLGGGLLMNQIAEAQQPFLWRTNVGATLLALDAQTNVYVKTANKVITLNSDGIPQVTNTFALNNPLRRDDSGNYYFAGVRATGVDGSGRPDFGTTGAFYLAKYTGAGTLVWSNNFGPTGDLIRNIAVNDLELDKSGNVYAGYTYNTSAFSFSSMIAKIDNTGSVLWDVAMPKAASATTVGATYVTVLSPTNGWALTYASRGVGPGPLNDAVLSRFDINGTATVITNWTTDLGVTPPLVLDSSGNFFTREGNLTKRDPSGAVLWQVSLFGSFALGSDPFGGVYTGGGGQYELIRFDSAGNVTWDAGDVLSSECELALSDSSGNRFYKFVDGSIARVAAPSAAVDPQSGEGIGSSGFLFSVKSDPNLICEILSSSNGTSWESLGFVTNNASGQMQFLDASATNSSQKYYRIQPR